MASPLAEHILILEQSIIKLVGAMKYSVGSGCTDHLDCCEDGGRFWHKSIQEAEDLLGVRIPETSDFPKAEPGDSDYDY